jgi:hypothetical protein
VSTADLPPAPRPAPFTAEALLINLSASVLSKARKAVLDHLVHESDPRSHPRVVQVGSLRPGATGHYRVSTDIDPVTGELSWITCTCAHGRKSGGGTCRCYHVGAALMYLCAM